MKITFVGPTPNITGGNRVIFDYAYGLTQKGHEVTFVSAKRYVSKRERLRILLQQLKPSNWSSSKQFKHHNLSEQVKFIQAQRPGPILADIVPDADVIIATWWETAYWIKGFPPEKGEKFYFMQDYGAGHQPLDKLIETWHFGYKIITISEWLDSIIQKFAPQKTAIVINGVDEAIFQSPERTKPSKPTIGFAYSELPTKGARFAVEAISLARKQLPDLQVVVLGKPSKEVTKELPSSTTIYYQVPNEQLSKIYASCSAWLFPSLNEGFGLPILESMACGTPVIAFASAAAPEILARGGGELSQIGDSKSMAKKIIKYCSMPSKEWEMHSKEAVKTVYPEYLVGHAIDNFEKALRNFPA